MLFGALAGWRQGFLMPLVAATGALLGLYALYAGPVAGAVPSGVPGLGLGVGVVVVLAGVLGRIGAGIASFVHRYEPLRRIDQGLGIPLGAATALVSVYLGLLAVVTFDSLLAPLHGAVTVDAAAVAAVRAAAAGNPQLGLIAGPEVLDELAAAVAKQAIPPDQLASIDQTLGFYETEFRPQLVKSVLAPLILTFGERAPLIGRHIAFPTQ